MRKPWNSSTPRPLSVTPASRIACSIGRIASALRLTPHYRTISSHSVKRCSETRSSLEDVQSELGKITVERERRSDAQPAHHREADGVRHRVTLVALAVDDLLRGVFILWFG